MAMQTLPGRLHVPFIPGLILLCFLLVCPSARAEGTAPGQSQLNDLVAELQEEYGVTGLIVGIQSGDGAPVIAVAGHSLPGMPVTPDMHFRIGAPSITTLTTILMQLVDEGTVTLDMPLATWFPQYPRADAITLGMLAGSRAGYFDYAKDPGFADAFYGDVFHVWTTKEVLDLTFALGMDFEPGTDFGYSHANFVILGELLSVATGRSLRELVETRVIEPLDLSSMRYSDNAGLTEPVLHAYTSERDVFENSTYWSPSWTSHTGFLDGDMAALLGLMRGLGSGRLLSESGFETLTAPINVGDAFNRPDFHYAYGVLVNDPWLSQSFSFGGYDGMVVHRRSDDVTIGVMDTLGEGMDSGPARAILDRVIATMLP